MVLMEVVEHLLVGPGSEIGGNKNTFNIDDVGYANASDVGMNVGALNNYNTDQTWVSGLSGSGSGGGWASGEGPTVLLMVIQIQELGGLVHQRSNHCNLAHCYLGNKVASQRSFL